MKLFKTKTQENDSTNKDQKVNPAVKWIAGALTAAATVAGGVGIATESSAANADHSPATTPASAPQTPGGEASVAPQKVEGGQTLQPKPVVEQATPVAPHTPEPVSQPTRIVEPQAPTSSAPHEVIPDDSGMMPSPSPTEVTPDDSGMMPSSQPSPSEVTPDDSGMMPTPAPTPQEVVVNDNGMAPRP